MSGNSHEFEGATSLVAPAQAYLALAFWGLCGLVFASTQAWSAPAHKSLAPVIYVSIPPQAWVLEQLGVDELAQIEILLPAASGHINYSPAPSQIRDLARARLFVRSSLPFENRVWDRIRGVNPDMAVVDAPVESVHDGQDHAHDHDHGEDPHFWLDPYLMLDQAREITAVLPSVLDIDADQLRSRMVELEARLAGVDLEVRSILAETERKSFWTFHGSWGHFSEHYGLEQHAIEFEGKETGLRTMLKIVSELESSGADFIIVEPGLDRSRLTVLENEAGLLHVELNPMARNYDRNLVTIANAIARRTP